MPSHTYQRRMLQEAGPDLALATQPKDDDGYYIPIIYRLQGRDAWAAMPRYKKAALSLEFITDLNQELKSRERKAANAGKAPPTAFTTSYAKKWAKSKGWLIVASESSHLEYRGKDKKVVAVRRDTLIGSDLVCLDPVTGFLILIQAGGKSERTPHWQRFLGRGGKKSCAECHASFYYVEFIREDHEPILMEQWA